MGIDYDGRKIMFKAKISQLERRLNAWIIVSSLMLGYIIYSLTKI